MAKSEYTPKQITLTLIVLDLQPHMLDVLNDRFANYLIKSSLITKNGYLTAEGKSFIGRSIQCKTKT